MKPFNVEQIKAAVEIALYKKNEEQRLRESEEKFRKAHDELERRIEERTAELVIANEKLNKRKISNFNIRSRLLQYP